MINKYIFISPEDNNIYFIKKNGTLNWWGKYDSTRLMPPIAMKNNVGIFLMNNEVKFFNPKKRQEILFKLKSDLKSNPIVIGNYIYMISQKNDSDVPAIFGVLTCETLDHAVERAGTKMGNAGADAARTAMEAANVMEQI